MTGPGGAVATKPSREFLVSCEFRIEGVEANYSRFFALFLVSFEVK